MVLPAGKKVQDDEEGLDMWSAIGVLGTIFWVLGSAVYGLSFVYAEWVATAQSSFLAWISPFFHFNVILYAFKMPIFWSGVVAASVGAGMMKLAVRD
jgi:hypothetical protein